MTANLGRSPATAEHDGIERLVEAERAWQQSLDAARSEGDRIIAAAETEAAEAERAFEASIPELVALRRRETLASVEGDVHGVAAEFARRALRYTQVSDALVQELAERIAASAPWVCTSDDGGDP
jgi:vacuolar-type H+-ATPase subunit H